MKKFLLIIALITILTAGCSGKNTSPTNEENTEQQNSYEKINSDVMIAPNFELETLDGTSIKLSQMRDKNIILNFWATWCGYCIIEMPDLQKLQKAHKGDLLVLTVNVGESRDVVQEFMDENNLDLTVALDTDMKVATNLYGLRSFPTTIAINKKGEAVKGYLGMLSYEEMEQLYEYFEE